MPSPRISSARCVAVILRSSAVAAGHSSPSSRSCYGRRDGRNASCRCTELVDGRAHGDRLAVGACRSPGSQRAACRPSTGWRRSQRAIARRSPPCSFAIRRQAGHSRLAPGPDPSRLLRGLCGGFLDLLPQLPSLRTRGRRCSASALAGGLLHPASAARFWATQSSTGPFGFNSSTSLTTALTSSAACGDRTRPRNWP